MYELQEAPAPADQDLSGLVHVVCPCDPDTALCGTDRTGAEWVPEDTPVGCVVCADLEWEHCPKCGDGDWPW